MKSFILNCKELIAALAVTMLAMSTAYAGDVRSANEGNDDFPGVAAGAQPAAGEASSAYADTSSTGKPHIRRTLRELLPSDEGSSPGSMPAVQTAKYTPRAQKEHWTLREMD